MESSFSRKKRTKARARGQPASQSVGRRAMCQHSTISSTLHIMYIFKKHFITDDIPYECCFAMMETGKTKEFWFDGLEIAEILSVEHLKGELYLKLEPEMHCEWQSLQQHFVNCEIPNLWKSDPHRILISEEGVYNLTAKSDTTIGEALGTWIASITRPKEKVIIFFEEAE